VPSHRAYARDWVDDWEGTKIFFLRMFNIHSRQRLLALIRQLS
jgi:hypothetical protein